MEAIKSSATNGNSAIEWIEQAVGGDRQALEALILSVQDMVYNLSLRMLGTIQDAEDATQEILVRVITQLATFQRKSEFSTWVYRIATNYLINCKKSMFARRPLSFEVYGADIDRGFIPDAGELMQNVSEGLLAEELKLSCTNVMLQCLDPESRCIYVLGIMFRADSKICGEILGITPEAYRKRLSRIRATVGGFLSEYCGLAGSGKCSCNKRVGYAIQTQRLNPGNLEYSQLQRLNDGVEMGFMRAMEEVDTMSGVFAGLPMYRSPEVVRDFLRRLLNADEMSTIKAEA